MRPCDMQIGLCHGSVNEILPMFSHEHGVRGHAQTDPPYRTYAAAGVSPSVRPAHRRPEAPNCPLPSARKSVGLALAPPDFGSDMSPTGQGKTMLSVSDLHDGSIPCGLWGPESHVSEMRRPNCLPSSRAAHPGAFEPIRSVTTLQWAGN